jgi:hypothetical protein
VVGSVEILGIIGLGDVDKGMFLNDVCLGIRLSLTSYFEDLFLMLKELKFES